MQAYIDSAKEKFDELESREQLMLIVGSFALIVMLFVFALYLPNQEKAAALREQISYNQEDVAWMQKASQTLKSNGATSSSSGLNRSLLALLDEQFKSSGMADSVKSIQPDGKGKAKIRLENCKFDDLITLAGKLESANGIIVERSNLEKASSAGRVSGNITFSRS